MIRKVERYMSKQLDSCRNEDKQIWEKEELKDEKNRKNEKKKKMRKNEKNERKRDKNMRRIKYLFHEVNCVLYNKVNNILNSI